MGMTGLYPPPCEVRVGLKPSRLRQSVTFWGMLHVVEDMSCMTFEASTGSFLTLAFENRKLTTTTHISIFA